MIAPTAPIGTRVRCDAPGVGIVYGRTVEVPEPSAAGWMVVVLFDGRSRFRCTIEQLDAVTA